MYSGDSFNSSLVAVVSVDPDVLKSWAASEGIKVNINFLHQSFKCNTWKVNLYHYAKNAAGRSERVVQ